LGDLLVVVGLGANLGDRLASLRTAAERIAEIGELRALSPVYETEAVDSPALAPPYLNAAVLLVSALGAETLMQRLLAIEAAMGRVRPTTRNAPRTIDLDLLWIDGLALATDTLTLPHPRLIERAFALGPLLDVAPDALDPTTRRPYAGLPCDRTTLRPVGAL